MSDERIVKDFCPVANSYVEITDTRPYANQMKMFVPKFKDKYPNLLCKKHCYENGQTPPDCLYVSITQDHPVMPGKLYEWISKTECVVKDEDPDGNTFFSHQFLKAVGSENRWRPCCSPQPSIEDIRSQCRRYGGPGAIVGS